MPISLTPAPGYALVELGEKYSNIKIAARAYESKANGIVLASEPGGLSVEEQAAWDELFVGKRAFWEELVAGAPITREGVDYAFIRIEAIQGYEEVASAE